MGGNVFKDGSGNLMTQRINRDDVPTTVVWLELLIKHPFLDRNLLGTTGISETSGDLDIAISSYTRDKEGLVKTLTDWVQHFHPNDPVRNWIHKSGISVHFRTPICGNEHLGFVQTDFMFGDVEWLKWSLRGEYGTGFKGRHRQILLASIAKARGFRWSANNGVMTRDTSIVLTNKPDAVATYILGSNCTAADLESVDTIMHRVLQCENYKSLISEAEESFSHEGLSLLDKYKRE